MILAVVFTAMIAVSVAFGAACGNMPAVSAAAVDGAKEAVALCISLTGVVCVFSGFMTVMDRSGLSGRLALVFRPLIRLLFPAASRDDETLSAIAANMSANMLGLGNAATPLGIRAACKMSSGCGGRATDELCLLVVVNTASIQLIPATVAALRASCGCASPFDILPAVWFSSALSVSAGVIAAKLMARFSSG
jgi:spore maturation protein A